MPLLRPASFVQLLFVVALLAIQDTKAAEIIHKLSQDRLVFQTAHGELHLAFYDDVAPITAKHIRLLGELGAYNTVDFFRVDRGFVAQTSDVRHSRLVPLNEDQLAEADKTVPLEVRSDVQHDRRGLLSLARHDDPNSGGSSFSIMLGSAPHLNMQYAIFGEVTAGIEMLAALEELPTKREGIFVMPLDRITILSTYTYRISNSSNTSGALQHQLCSEVVQGMQQRMNAQSVQLHEIRQRCLPGT